MQLSLPDADVAWKSAMANVRIVGSQPRVGATRPLACVNLERSRCSRHVRHGTVRQTDSYTDICRQWFSALAVSPEEASMAASTNIMVILVVFSLVCTHGSSRPETLSVEAVLRSGGQQDPCHRQKGGKRAPRIVAIERV